MKTKFFLLVAMFFASATLVNAQSKTITSPKYQGEVSVGVGFFDIYNLYLHTVHGVRFNDNLFVGIGTGATIFLPIGMLVDDGSNYEAKSDYSIPLFLNVKGYYPVSAKTSLFASFDCGAHFGVGSNNYNGAMISPAVGVNFNNRVNLSIGYEYKSMNYKHEGLLSYSTNGMPVKIGFTF